MDNVTKTKYKLLTYGIPVQDLPLTPTGAVKTKNHQQFTNIRRHLEASRDNGSDTSDWVTHPGLYDVLFSKGGNTHHEGNLDFQQLMESKMSAYNCRQSRKEGKLIREEIIRLVYQRRGRFLELNRKGGWWVEIKSMDVLHSKINTSMYDHNRRMIARENRQKVSSSTVKFLEGGTNKTTAKRQKLCGGFAGSCTA
mmetsp:Transcript_10571/g.19376  ORF Transcript_10571/g.19376 Transcript_10571/m.19376 type:complete len:196 (+) Transcript_10571:135-722(+)